MRVLLYSCICAFEIVFLGCIPLAYVRTAQDIAIPFDRDGSIFISKKPGEISVAEKNFSTILKNELEHFNIRTVNNKNEADYILEYGIVERAALGQFMRYEYQMNNGFCLGDTCPSMWCPVNYQPVIYEYTYPIKFIHISLYQKDAYSNKQRAPIWEGEISAEKETYKNHLRDLTDNLLGYFGRSFEGEIKVQSKEILKQ